MAEMEASPPTARVTTASNPSARSGSCSMRSSARPSSTRTSG